MTCLGGLSNQPDGLVSPTGPREIHPLSEDLIERMHRSSYGTRAESTPDGGA
jgi:hypothetical protein